MISETFPTPRTALKRLQESRGIEGFFVFLTLIPPSTFTIDELAGCSFFKETKETSDSVIPFIVGIKALEC